MNQPLQNKYRLLFLKETHLTNPFSDEEFVFVEIDTPIPSTQRSKLEKVLDEEYNYPTVSMCLAINAKGQMHLFDFNAWKQWDLENILTYLDPKLYGELYQMALALTLFVPEMSKRLS